MWNIAHHYQEMDYKVSRQETVLAIDWKMWNKIHKGVSQGQHKESILMLGKMNKIEQKTGPKARLEKPFIGKYE